MGSLKSLSLSLFDVTKNQPKKIITMAKRLCFAWWCCVKKKPRTLAPFFCCFPQPWWQNWNKIYFWSTNAHINLWKIQTANSNNKKLINSFHAFLAFALVLGGWEMCAHATPPTLWIMTHVSLAIACCSCQSATQSVPTGCVVCPFLCELYNFIFSLWSDTTIAGQTDDWCLQNPKHAPGQLCKSDDEVKWLGEAARALCSDDGGGFELVVGSVIVSLYR